MNNKYQKNMKGFTLVELLAVIVVLAIIMMIAVTSVTGILEKSRKNAFLQQLVLLSMLLEMMLSSIQLYLPVGMKKMFFFLLIY